MKLYKYSAVDENCLSGLINSQLWFSDPRSFNDPFDCDLRLYEKIYEKRITKIKDEYLIKINEIIKKCQADNLTDGVIEVISKKESILKLIENHKNEILDDGHKKFGILCLTKNKGESNTLMWSHYGNSHKGVMLEFETDANDEFFKVQLSIIYINSLDSKYYEEKEQIKKILLQKYDEKSINNLFIFLFKAKQWEYEQEVRVVKTKIKNNQRLFKYDPNCLTGIYFGLKTTEEHKQTIKQIIQLKGLKNTKLYQAEKVENSFNLVYTEICD
ncbi:MAG: hypothetical protein RL344_130 [Pseudomonadota bacterium]|jgi:hypothetical protein